MGVTTKKIHLFQFALRPSVPPPVCRPSLPLPPSSRRASLPAWMLSRLSWTRSSAHTAGKRKASGITSNLKWRKKQNKTKNYLFAAVGAKREGRIRLTQVQWEEMRSSLQECDECVKLSAGGWPRCARALRGVSLFFLCVKMSAFAFAVCFVAAHVEVEHGALPSAY